jgi:hypothetical protein
MVYLQNLDSNKFLLLYYDEIVYCTTSYESHTFFMHLQFD